MRYRSITALSVLAVFGLAVGLSAQTRTNVGALRQFATRQSALAQAQRQEAVLLAQRLGIPIRIVEADGTVTEIGRIVDGHPMYRQTDNVEAAQTISVDRLWPRLQGNGIVLGEWDGGRARQTHQELVGRVFAGDAAGIIDHATHVAGTMIASGVDPLAKGMSFRGTVRSYDWDFDTSEMAIEAAAGLRLSNHSYGWLSGWSFSSGNWYWYGDTNVSQTEDYNFGYYDVYCQDWDALAYNAPFYLICKSAGNDRGQGPNGQPTGYYWNGAAWVPNLVARDVDGGATGYDTIPTNGNAKNLLTVGAVNPILGGYAGPGSVVMSSFSGWGPTDDGRVKPDVVACGVGVYSCIGTSDTAYAYYNGTSMSTPNTTGALGLLVQRRRQLHPNDMRSATLKAIVIHTADDCTGIPGPSYAYGWGIVNAWSAANLIRASLNPFGASRIYENVLANGNSWDVVVNADGATPLKVTLCWTDPAATLLMPALDNPTPRLVNDLDVRVIGPTGAWFPWTLDPNNPAAAATRGDNVLDNVEQVYIPTPGRGKYRVRITHKGNLVGGSQAYSVVVTGTNSIGMFTLRENTVTGGLGTVGYVRLADPAKSLVTIEVRSSHPAVQVPSKVFIGRGQSEAWFPIRTMPSAYDYDAVIRVIYAENERSAGLMVLSPEVESVSLDPPSLIGGRVNAGCTVKLTGPAPPSGLWVDLVDNSAATDIPSRVTSVAVFDRSPSLS